MATDERRSMTRKYRDQVCGCEMTGCGGGGYMILISEKPVPTALQVTPSVL